MKKSIILIAVIVSVFFAQWMPTTAHDTPPATGEPSDTAIIIGGDPEPGNLDGFGEEDDEGLLSSTPHLTTRDTVHTYNLSGHPTNAANSAHSIYIYKGQKRIR